MKLSTKFVHAVSMEKRNVKTSNLPHLIHYGQSKAAVNMCSMTKFFEKFCESHRKTPVLESKVSGLYSAVLFKKRLGEVFPRET